MKDNGITSNGVGGNQLLIVDGVYGYLYNCNTNTMLRSDAFTGANSTGPSAFPAGAKFITYLDGYFIVTNETMNFYVSDLYDGSSWGGLASGGAVASSDTIQVPYSLHQELYLIKEYNTEIFYDAGVATTMGCPFLRRSGAVLDFGTPSPYSVAMSAGGLFFLATMRTGQVGEFAGVVQLTGYEPKVISTEAIAFRMSQFTLSDAFGYCYIDGKHVFYVLTFPTDNTTFAYDVSTDMWHERSTYVGGDIYAVNRHASNGYARYAEKNLVTDYASGKIFSMSTDIYADGDQPIVSYVVSPYVYDKNEMENLFISKLIVDAETGVGLSGLQDAWYFDGTWLFDGSVVLDPTLYNQGDGDPKAVLSWSSDGGHTWSNEYDCSIGKVGETQKRLIWRRLGKARNKVFRLAIANKVKKILINCFVEGSV
jgi:hypothetical protein